MNLWFTGYHTWYSMWSFNTSSLQKNVWRVIKLWFCLSKTFWPRCRLIWTASWRFCMNSFGQRWQRNSWKVHRNILYFSVFSIQSAQFFIHSIINIRIWTFIPRCCRSWFSRALCRRNLKKKFIFSCLKMRFLTVYHILHACIGKVFLQCVW